MGLTNREKCTSRGADKLATRYERHHFPVGDRGSEKLNGRRDGEEHENSSIPVTVVSGDLTRA